MEKALFSFKKYCFNDIHLCLSDSDSDDKSLDLKFDPMGVFHSKTKTFELTLQFKAITSKQHKEIISIKCVAEFVSMDDFVEKNCQIIVSACRSKGDTKSKIYDLENKGYTIIWTTNDRNKDQEIQKQLNKRYAERIVKLIEDRINKII
jgi:hypothetical protein